MIDDPEEFAWQQLEAKQNKTKAIKDFASAQDWEAIAADQAMTIAMLRQEVLDEREACAKLCKEQLENTMLLTSYPPKSAAAFQILQLIKARGDKHD